MVVDNSEMQSSLRSSSSPLHVEAAFDAAMAKISSAYAASTPMDQDALQAELLRFVALSSAKIPWGSSSNDEIGQESLENHDGDEAFDRSSGLDKHEKEAEDKPEPFHNGANGPMASRGSEFSARQCDFGGEASQDSEYVTHSFANQRPRGSTVSFGTDSMALLNEKRDWMLHPNSRRRMMWDLSALFMVMADAIALPFEMSFYDNKPDTALVYLGMTFFTLDIILNFRTGYVVGGVPIMDPSKVAKNYLRGWFLLDFLSTVPIHLIVGAIVGGGDHSDMRLMKIAKLVKLVRLMRLLKLLKINRLIDRIETYFGSVHIIHVFTLLKVLSVIMLTCHWNACLFWTVGHPDAIFYYDEPAEQRARHWTVILRKGAGVSYTDEFKWVDKPMQEQYIFCLYWTLGVMRTMPSEVYPENFWERVYTMVFMFLAFSLFAVCISKITASLNKFSARRGMFDERLAHFRGYMRRHKLPVVLQERAKEYLEHLFATRRISAPEDDLRKALSDHLTTEIRCLSYSPLLKAERFFATMSKALLRTVVLMATCSVASPGDVVAYQSETAVSAIGIISGTLRNLTRLKSRPVVSGDWFDIEALVVTTVQHRLSSIMAESMTELLNLNCAHFHDLRDSWPALEKHCEEYWRSELSWKDEKNE